jgi:hypothetical protein
MTSTDIAETPQQRVAQTRSQPGKVTGKLSQAIDRMVELGEPWDEAGRAVGMDARSMRKALAKPHVIRHLKQRREVFRESACAGNIHTLLEIRAQRDNQMARVQAVKALEQLGDDPAQKAQSVQSPGIVIVVGAGAVAAPVLTEHQRALDAKPLIEQGSDVLGQTVTGNDT